MEKYFYLDESPVYKHKLVLRVNVDNCPFPNGTRGSYQVLAARLLGLSYPDFLRYVRDRLGADLVGINHKYITPYFEDNPTAQQLVILLNKRMERVMYEQKHPYELQEDSNGKLTKVPFKS